MPEQQPDDRPVYVISVAAELAGMHPQTLRGYDRLGLVSPGRAQGRGRGDIHYRLVVDVPRSLSKEQREVVDELAAVMDGNPRERMLKDNG